MKIFQKEKIPANDAKGLYSDGRRRTGETGHRTFHEQTELLILQKNLL